jgi:hypothetical protein
MLFFTVQSVAAAIEVEAVTAHDQIHHQVEGDHDEINHNETDHEGKHHAHLCHHHHGEHTAKVLLQTTTIIDHFDHQLANISYSLHYDNVFGKSLYRPPIS